MPNLAEDAKALAELLTKYGVETVEELKNKIENWKNKSEELAELLKDYGVDTVDKLKEKIKELSGGINVPGNGSPSPIAPGDPLQPLKRLAEAIDEAESILNQQNLVIASGTVEAALTVNVGGAAAEAKVNLNVQPRPFQ
ncbi:MAG: hypothetical protein ACHWZW_20625 [Spirulina sp.]